MSETGAIQCSGPVADWLLETVHREASDLHLVAGAPPMLRIHGCLHSIEHAPLSPPSLRSMLHGLCPEESRARFGQDLNLDFSLHAVLGDSTHRFRVNYFLNNRRWGACFRAIPVDIPTLDWAQFPVSIAERLAHFRNGLVVVSGVTGSGKSTTLAMLLNMLNAEGNHRIVTIEEPIEYVFPTMPDSLVTQREVGLDVHSFSDGLKYSLRQDPDVILVGEIRDYETAQAALTAAETGLLVFATLHARDAKGVISRYADLYPIESQHEVRAQLSSSLRAIVCQHLLPSAIEGRKRELALEILFNTGPVASGIRAGKLQSVENNILTGRDAGMVTLSESVSRLREYGRITDETARRFCET